MHIIAKNIGVHTLAVLVDAQTQATTYFLPLANLTAALFCQSEVSASSLRHGSCYN